MSRLEKHNRKGLGVEGARKEYGEEAPEDQDRKEGNWLEMVDAPCRMYCRIVWCTRLRRSIRGPDNGGGGAGGGGGVDSESYFLGSKLHQDRCAGKAFFIVDLE